MRKHEKDLVSVAPFTLIASPQQAQLHRKYFQFAQALSSDSKPIMTGFMHEWAESSDFTVHVRLDARTVEV